jgi:hypothetical protein
MVSIFVIFLVVVLGILVVGSLELDNLKKAVFALRAKLFGLLQGQTCTDEDHQGPGRLGVMLALAVAAADGKLGKAEIAIIERWAVKNIELGFGKIRRYINYRRLNAALNEAIDFFHAGNKLDTDSICKELIHTATAAFRYDILELCLYVAGANGVASEKALGALQRYAGLLGAGADKFRSMVEKILPVTVHETVNLGLLLGLTPNMDVEEIREGLNREYDKWNARTWNHNPRVQEQAEQMLQLIADTRRRYTA